MTATYTTINAVLKTLYPDGALPKGIMYEADPFVGLVKKNPKFNGEAMKIPLQYRGGGAPGRTVAGAQGQVRPVGYRAFNILATQKTLRHVVARWERQAAKAAQGQGEGAFVDMVKKEIEGAQYSLARNIARDVWGNGGNTLGRIASGQGTTTIVLTDPDDVVNFEEGYTVMAATADPGVASSGTVRVGSQTITAIDRQAGTITGSAVWTTAITGAAANDFLFLNGDVESGSYLAGGNGGTGGRGVATFIPDAAPGTSDLLYTVNRSVDVTRLAGWRLPTGNTGLSVDEAIQLLAVYIKREGGKVDKCFLSPRNWHRLQMAAQGRTIYQVSPDGMQGKVKIGYNSFKISTAAGDVDVIPTAQLKSDRFYLLNMGTWTLNSLGECPEIVQEDGLDFARLSDQNVFESRLVYDIVLSCDNPGSNGVGFLTPPTV